MPGFVGQASVFVGSEDELKDFFKSRICRNNSLKNIDTVYLSYYFFKRNVILFRAGSARLTLEKNLLKALDITEPVNVHVEHLNRNKPILRLVK